MKRRKFIIGTGALAAGGVAALGTGAFNFADVKRGIDVNVTDDASAFLALEDTSDYADGSGDQLQINFDGDGLNEDLDYSFTGVFAIRNQGLQSVGVWLEDDDNNDAVQWYGADNDDTSNFDTSIEDSADAYALNPGEEVYVNVVVLLQDNDESDLPQTLNVKADASAGN